MPTESRASITFALRDRDNVPHRGFACAPEDIQVWQCNEESVFQKVSLCHWKALP